MNDRDQKAKEYAEELLRNKLREVGLFAFPASTIADFKAQQPSIYESVIGAIVASLSQSGASEDAGEPVTEGIETMLREFKNYFSPLLVKSVHRAGWDTPPQIVFDGWIDKIIMECINVDRKRKHSLPHPKEAEGMVGHNKENRMPWDTDEGRAAGQYLGAQSIDFGDLNELAETNITDAFIAGAKWRAAGLPSSGEEKTGWPHNVDTSDLDLKTLLYVQHSFDLQSDSSPHCNGYRRLCDLVEKVSQLPPPPQEGAEAYFPVSDRPPSQKGLYAVMNNGWQAGLFDNGKWQVWSCYHDTHVDCEPKFWLEKRQVQTGFTKEDMKMMFVQFANKIRDTVAGNDFTRDRVGCRTAEELYDLFFPGSRTLPSAPRDGSDAVAFVKWMSENRIHLYDYTKGLWKTQFSHDKLTAEQLYEKFKSSAPIK